MKPQQADAAEQPKKEKMMKRILMTLVILAFVLSAPFAVMASSHMDHDGHDHGKHKGHDHSKHEKMDHSGHAAGMGGMMVLGDEDEDGVRAVGKVKVYDAEAVAAMSKMGMGATHHFMVYFTDEKTGEPVTEGVVALKVKTGDGDYSDAIMLMQMGSGFGADISVPEGEKAKLKVGTKLADGKKRQFKFEIEDH